MQLNFDYDKVIIVKYLIGGGGKFLCTCLGLSHDAIFTQKDLAQMQLDDKFPIEKKLKYLLLATKQQSERQIWDDWGLGGFWGPPERSFIRNNNYLQGNTTNIIEEINPIVHECIDNNKFILLPVHDDKVLISILKYWKNSKVIIFKNELKFASTRVLGKYSNIDSFSSVTKFRFDQFKLNNLSYEWDCDWYYSRDKTVSEIEKLYDSFKLSGFNSEVISEFYGDWRNAIKF